MKKWLVQLLVLPFLFNMGAPTYAEAVTLAWDANAESDLAGYKLYQGNAAGGPYTLVQTLGLVTTTQVSGLPDGVRCWVLTAFDTFANESGYSNEVCMTVDTIPPVAPQHFVRVP